MTESTLENEAKYLLFTLCNELRRTGYDAVPSGGVVHVKDRRTGTCASVPLRWFFSKSAKTPADAARVAVECVEEMVKAGKSPGNDLACWYLERGGPPVAT